MTNTYRKWISKIYILPLFFVLLFCLIQSVNFPLHDFSNSFFAAKLVSEKQGVSNTLFDIYAFNSFAWELGYPEVLMDFYVNSPFTVFAFYPLTFLSNPYTAKLLFNILSCFIFLVSIIYLNHCNNQKSNLLVILLPFLFYVPFRNQILFGQTYFLIFGLLILCTYYLQKGKEISGITSLVVASLLKIFPVFYGIIWVLNKQWKTILWGIGITISLIILSFTITGIDLWNHYFFAVIPNTFTNNSSVNFQFNAQSLDVFLKSLFIQDDYYNPEAFFNNRNAYFLSSWIFKSIILGVAIATSVSLKKEYVKLLSLWIVAVLLLQSRTATYTQILWILPAFVVFTSSRPKPFKIIFFVLLFLICNFPLSLLESLPLFFKFSRLGISVVLSVMLFKVLNSKPNRRLNTKSILITMIFLSILPIRSIIKENPSEGTYVLTHKYFMIFDFTENKGTLQYAALGKNGMEEIQTEIPIYSFDSLACELNNNQIFYKGHQLTFNSALKKKPVLINQSDIYYLSDYNSRRGAFTLKKLKIKNPTHVY